MNRKGFAIVEVLVAFMILTSALSLLTYAQKTFNSNIKKIHNYEILYTTLLSLKNKVDIEMALGDKKHFTGKLNNINYNIDIEKLEQRNNLTYDAMSGKYTKGMHFYTLYRATITLLEPDKKYTFYKLKTYFDKKLVDEQFKGF